ncbi:MULTISPECIES: hypothetical protein [unclassified Yoonia]|uniref:hypothetical protein n=1 Tax=unclassified Yoonia TaxID=2629118 RepID=UPI002AFE89A6|nr:MULTISPECIES: hypothetical protein [unclassified Yoonia]
MSWTTEAYLSKAQSYWGKGTNKERGSDDYIFAVSMCVELTIRGVLCSFNPALNAAMDEESILFSVGVNPNRPAKSVDLGTAFSRLIRLVPQVTEQEQAAIRALIDIRNRELHSDEAAFEGMASDTVMPSILSFLVRVADAIGHDLEQLLTPSDAMQARGTFEALSKDRSRRVSELIRIQKDRFFGQSEVERNRLYEENAPKFSSAVMNSGHHVKALKCPSCGGSGILGGSPAGRSSALLDDDGIFHEIRIIPSVFSCKICSLEIKGLDELISAKMPHEFISRDDVDAVAHFGIDVMEYVDTDEIIREYNYEHEYMDE